MFYPEELVEEIRIKNDIVDVIGSYVKLQKKGGSHMGLCPFHNEKSPSFSVSSSKQMYHCFGCGVGGNVFTFIMEYENYTFVETIKYLAGKAGINLPEVEYSEEAKKQAGLKNRLLEINKEAAKYYYYQLKSNRGQAAYEYLKNRALSAETIKKFGLGFSNKTGDDLYQYLKHLGYEDSILKEAGLFSFDEKKKVYDKFWNRVMFPIMDVNNRVIGFGGRVMGEGTPKYLNSPETKLFDKSRNLYGLNFARIARRPNILICEGYMDVIALHQAGFTNAVASLGTAFTGLQANLLKRYTGEVLLTYDSDEAGTKAALRAIPILKEAGLTVKVIDMKPYKDPDEFIKALGADEFTKRIESARNSFLFEIDVLEKEYDLNDPEAKTRFFNEVAKKLLIFTEEIERNIYTQTVADKYLIGFENLKKLVNRYGAQLIGGQVPRSKESGVEGKRKNVPEDGMKQSQKILLTWLIEDTRIFDKIQGIIKPEDFTEELYKEVAQMVFEQYKTEHTVTPAKIINRFESKEEQNETASLFNMSMNHEMSDMEREKALNETVLRIKKNSLDLQSKMAIENNDILALQSIIKEQADLQKLHISLHDG
ncbi:DNA primase [Anaerocolumna cellulosilytica]|uniref:DNA primase n=1 Tax=Anaerocolumna cellulosilytica TaxID=433286 RepID=A0A6S6R2T9_9FIRM|nr:DNA primase [Anaerocolumna cellulosilytica]MBB5194404.1 DNA primase [Anaerocolumna cellulosilytica]BCJ93348.1 DNA primase [Anaerocolumna cellulosilytica]